MSDNIKSSPANAITSTLLRTEAELNELRAEVARLKAGGCARDQRTTQYCAEAVAMSNELNNYISIADRLAQRLRTQPRLDARDREVLKDYEQLKK